MADAGCRIAYLGPAGTFTHQAALRLGEGAEYRSYNTPWEVMHAVAGKEVKLGVLPVENSVEGSVHVVLDLLTSEFNLMMVAEIVQPVEYYLFMKDENRQGPEAIASHPQALAQCRRFLNRYYPHTMLVETLSTAAAAQLAAERSTWAALAPLAAGHYYNLKAVAGPVVDWPENSTRFMVVARYDCALDPGFKYKTSLCFTLVDRPGALCAVLQEFAQREINLTRLESRPLRRRLGEYRFYLDLEGHRREKTVTAALQAVEQMVIEYKIFGSYLVSPVSWREIMTLTGGDGSAPPSNNNDQVDETGKQEGRETEQEGREKGGKNNGLYELRRQIDRIDAQIINLLGQRAAVVQHIARFKASAEEVRDPKREEEVLERVRDLALAHGLEPEVVDEMYRLLFSYFVSLQLRNKKGLSL